MCILLAAWQGMRPATVSNQTAYDSGREPTTGAIATLIALVTLSVMLQTLAKMKPAAPVRIHLLLAAITWTTVGTGLLTAGTIWSVRSESNLLLILLAAAAAVGILKAVFVLRRTSARATKRIMTRGDNRCIGGYISWRTWVLVAIMVGTGRLLRSVGLPPIVVGFIYVAVGSALLVASLRLWQAYLQYRPESPGMQESRS